MRVALFIVGLLSLAFWGFGAFDMWAVLTAWPPYAEQYGTDMLEWIQNFPLWRKAAWGASVGFGVIGSLMMLVRMRGAGSVLLLAWLLLAGGFAYDIVLQDGLQNYGQQGAIASSVLIVLAALFAWAGFAAPAKTPKPSSAASSDPPQAAMAPTPEPIIHATPEAAATTVAAPAEASAPPVDPAPTAVEAAPPEAETTPSPPEIASQEAATGGSNEILGPPPPAPDEKPSGG